MSSSSMSNPIFTEQTERSTKPQQQKKIVMYVSPWCGYCIRAKNLLTKKGWEFEEINVDDDAEKRRWLVKVTGRRTVPQIFIGDESVGGFDDIYELDRRGELDRKVCG